MTPRIGKSIKNCDLKKNPPLKQVVQVTVQPKRSDSWQDNFFDNEEMEEQKKQDKPNQETKCIDVHDDNEENMEYSEDEEDYDDENNDDSTAGTGKRKSRWSFPMETEIRLAQWFKQFPSLYVKAHDQYCNQYHVKMQIYRRTAEEFHCTGEYFNVYTFADVH